MSVRKKYFRDQPDFANYLRSAPVRVVPVAYQVSREYPGMVRIVEIVSNDSGKSLSINVDYSSFGCDSGGRLSSMSRVFGFEFNDPSSLLEFLHTHCGVSVTELRTKLPEPQNVPSPYDEEALVLSYEEGWEKFETHAEANRLPEQQWSEP